MTEEIFVDGLPKTDITQVKAVIEKRREDNKKGTDHPKLRIFGGVVYNFLLDFLNEDIFSFPNWQVFPKGDVIPVAIAHEDFQQANQEFLPHFVAGRIKAQSKFSKIVNLFKTHGLLEYSNSNLTPIPALCMQVDNLSTLAESLGVDQAVIKGALDEVVYLKAQNHYILGSREEPHSLPSYVGDKSKQFGLSAEKFIELQQLHELVQLPVHPLMERRFGEYFTWLDEGIGDFLAGFIARAKAGLKQLSLIPTMESLMEEGVGIGASKSTNDADVLHAKGWLLVSSIAHSYSQENPKVGILTFAKKLFIDGSELKTSLNAATVSILKEDSLEKAVSDNVREIFTKTVNS